MGTYNTHAPSSITRTGAFEPFDLQVSRNQIPLHKSMFRVAYTSFAVSGSTRAVWNRATAYTFPASASTMTLSSSATGDTTQTVLISGLDANYAQISEVLTLNGQTAVTSTLTYLRINDMAVISGAPTGSIYFGTGSLTAGVPANVYGFISAGDGAMLAAIYTVPAGYTLYITNGSSVTSGLATAGFLTLNFRGVINGVDYLTAKVFAPSGFQNLPYNPPIRVPEKSDLYDTVINSAAGPDQVSVTLSGYLIKNDMGS